MTYKVVFAVYHRWQRQVSRVHTCDEYQVRAGCVPVRNFLTTGLIPQGAPVEVLDEDAPTLQAMSSAPLLGRAMCASCNGEIVDKYLLKVNAPGFAFFRCNFCEDCLV